MRSLAALAALADAGFDAAAVTTLAGWLPGAATLLELTRLQQWWQMTPCVTTNRTPGPESNALL